MAHDLSIEARLGGLAAELRIRFNAPRARGRQAATVLAGQGRPFSNTLQEVPVEELLTVGAQEVLRHPQDGKTIASTTLSYARNRELPKDPALQEHLKSIITALEKVELWLTDQIVQARRRPGYVELDRAHRMAAARMAQLSQETTSAPMTLAERLSRPVRFPSGERSFKQLVHLDAMDTSEPLTMRNAMFGSIVLATAEAVNQGRHKQIANLYVEQIGQLQFKNLTEDMTPEAWRNVRSSELRDTYASFRLALFRSTDGRAVVDPDLVEFANQFVEVLEGRGSQLDQIVTHQALGGQSLN